MFLKEDIHRFISSTEFFLRDIRGPRYTGLKKVNFFVGHPVLRLSNGSSDHENIVYMVNARKDFLRERNLKNIKCNNMSRVRETIV